jgi:hypothetical protein
MVGSKSKQRERESLLIYISETLSLQQIEYKEKQWGLYYLLSKILFRHFLHYLRRITTESIITTRQWTKCTKIRNEHQFVTFYEFYKNLKDLIQQLKHQSNPLKWRGRGREYNTCGEYSKKKNWGCLINWDLRISGVNKDK